MTGWHTDSNDIGGGNDLIHLVDEQWYIRGKWKARQSSNLFSFFAQ